MRTLRCVATWVVAVNCGLSLVPVKGAEGGRFTIDESPLKPEVRTATSYSDVVKNVAPSVVNISTSRRIKFNQNPFLEDPIWRRFFEGPQEEGQGRPPRTRNVTSLGSGVIVSEDGYILTNDHVIDSADEITVILGQRGKEYRAKVVGRDSKTDLSVLKIEESSLPAITIGDSDQLEVGDAVLAIGNPFGLRQTVTSGMVSAIGRGNMGIEDYEDFIQTDAAINPGNSGGALVDAQGRLVGINTAIVSRSGGSQGIGFAIPINMARYVMDSLIREGKVSRGFLGVGIQDLDPALAKAFGAKNTSGALVREVTKGSAAAEAGVKAGDIVIEVEGKTVTDSRALRLMVARILPDTSVDITVLREGKERHFNIKLKEQPDQLAGEPAARPEGAKDEVLKEVAVSDLTDEARMQYHIPKEVVGALIVAVEEDSPASEADLSEGNVILEINQTPIKSAEDAVKATHGVTDKTVLLRVWSEGTVRFVVVDESKGK